MGNTAPKQVPGFLAGAQFLPYPYPYRCPFGRGGEETAKLSAAVLRNFLDDAESGMLPAAAVLELVQGEGGVIPAPDDWVRDVRAITRDHSIPMIVDEVQSGWGRTGRLYAFEHSGIEPDVLVLSKAIGGGLPLAVIVYDGKLDQWLPGAHAGTFRGNQLAMVAGMADTTSTGVAWFLLIALMIATPAWRSRPSSMSSTTRSYTSRAIAASASSRVNH